jgi:hypothetical protein
MSVSFVERELTIDGHTYILSFPIDEAFALGDKVIVLFDPNSSPEFGERMSNLVAVAGDSSTVWEAELPTNFSGDRYYQIASRDPLVADSNRSFSCTIDSSSGQIISKTFYK